MKYYKEITLLATVEIPIYFLWEKVYQQVHLALVEVQDVCETVGIGVSFPEYDADGHQLGSKLRLFAVSSNELEKLQIEKWLSLLRDYCKISSIRPVPENVVGHVFFKRIQVKSSNRRLAKRKAKRKGISFEEAFTQLHGRPESVSNLPYIHVKSFSSNKRYRLMIGQVGVELVEKIGRFSTYGLSSIYSVPIF